MDQKYLIKRDEWYSYRRRVPRHLAHLDNRKEIKISLKTKCPTDAIVKGSIYNNQIENYWKALVLAGSAHNSAEKYRATVQLAKAHGFAYKTTDQIAASTLNEIIDRLTPDIRTQHESDALMGTVKQPIIRLSESCQLFWPLITDRLVEKSDHQVRKWKNPRQAAMDNFIAVIGDKSIVSLLRSDILKFKTWCSTKISHNWSPNTANKQMRFVRDIIGTVAIHHQLEIDVDSLFVKTRFQDIPNSRPPFEANYVQNTLLPSLTALNIRDRMVVYAMADTGAREVEIFGLHPEDITIDAEVPFIWIRPREGYRLKTRTSERKIPLVGKALEAFQKFPNGFEQIGNPDTFSTIANNYLKNHNLKPTPQHTIYSLRHTFKDRLRDIEAPEEIIDGLMGHKKSGPKYGRGHKLETKYKWLSKIAYS